MGSTLAGVKAGVLAGVAYIGSLAVFNVIILYAAKPAVLNYISNNFQQGCPLTSGVNGTSVADCYASLAPVYVPFIAFIGFFVAILWAGIFGRFYESIPGRSAYTKGIAVALVVAINLILFQLEGVTFETAATEAITVFLVVTTLAFGVMLGDLYVRYTRTVLFVSQDAKALKIMVDHRDVTGKTRTFAVKSTHNVRADTSGGSAFREWVVSGGVTVEDQKSYETPMEVDGDGMLKAIASKKY